MKVEDWCTQQDVTRHAYYYWLRKIREDACENLPPVREESKSVPFKKLEVTASILNTTAAVIIHLPSASVEVREGTSQILKCFFYMIILSWSNMIYLMDLRKRASRRVAVLICNLSSKPKSLILCESLSHSAMDVLAMVAIR